MTVCFFVTDSPITEVPALDYDDQPMLDETGNPLMCHEYVLPYFEISNVNFIPFMRSLGCSVGEGYHGTFQAGELPDLRRRIIAALNLSSNHLRAPQQIGIIFDAGMSRDRLDRYLNNLLSVVVAAQEHQSTVRYG